MKTVAYSNDLVFDYDETTGALTNDRPSGVSNLTLVSRALIGNRWLVARGNSFAALRTLAVTPGTGLLTVTSEVTLPPGRNFGYNPVVVGRTIVAHSGSTSGSGSHTLETHTVNEATGAILSGASQSPTILLPVGLLPHPRGRWLFSGLPNTDLRNPQSWLGVTEVHEDGRYVLGERLSYPGLDMSATTVDAEGRYLYFVRNGDLQNQGTIAVLAFDETTGKVSPVSEGVPPDLRRFQLDGAVLDPSGRFLAVATRRYREDTTILQPEVHILAIERTGPSVSFRHVDGFVQARWDGPIGLFWSSEGRFLYCRNGVFELGADGRFLLKGTETRRLSLLRIPLV